MIVRKAKPEDALRLSELYNQLVNNPAVKVDPEQIQALYDDERSMLFVCEYQGDVVGSVLVSLCSDVMFRKQPFAVVENVIVDAVAWVLDQPYLRKLKLFALIVIVLRSCCLVQLNGQIRTHFLKNRVLKGQ